MKRSHIAWTDLSGEELNFVLGCSEVSPGCAHCYAAAIMKRGGKNFHEVRWYPNKLKKLQDANWGRLLLDVQQARTPAWRRGTKVKPMAFVVDMGDLFHPCVPDGFIIDAMIAMLSMDWVDWQVLTKRPRRMHDICLSIWDRSPVPKHIWLGVTGETQHFLDERLPWLHRINSDGVKFASIEPMLEPVTIHNEGAFLNWVICGAESGPERRPFDPLWARNLYYECRNAGIAFFGKQDSGFRPGVPLLIDGHVIQEFPK